MREWIYVVLCMLCIGFVSANVGLQDDSSHVDIVADYSVECAVLNFIDVESGSPVITGMMQYCTDDRENMGTQFVDLHNGFTWMTQGSTVAKMDTRGLHVYAGVDALELKQQQGTSANHVVCWKANKALGYCVNAPNSVGVCTCV